LLNRLDVAQCLQMIPGGRFATICFGTFLSAAGASAAEPGLMPLPVSVVTHSGDLQIDSSFRVVLRGPADLRMHAAIRRFLTRLSRISGVTLGADIEATPEKAGGRLLIEWQENSPPVPRAVEDESYAFEIESAQAQLRAPTSTGILRGLETLLQSVRTDGHRAIISGVSVRDQPRFAWRGMLLDCSRHFIPVEAIKRTLDGMAAFKYNVLHWHLSDDQGFRMESKVFPKLTAVGSDGLFYTQDQIRDIISFAADRGIRVVPEFDMPGHATSWFVGYPELASAPGPYTIQRHIGLFEPVMDPSRPEVYAFLDGLIGEIATLFPDPYFHIGGDEVDPAQWKRSASVQAFMKSEGIANTQALQEHFNRRVGQLLALHGKRMIGWDEILGANLPPDSMVQSWRGLSSLAQTVRSGHLGLLSFGYYLDQLQPAAEHYLVDPFDGEVAVVAQSERARVLGGEACLWTEYVTPDNLDYRLWPRAAAIAERLWSPPQVRDVESMYSRLSAARGDLRSVDIDPELSRRRFLERITDSAAAQSLAIFLESLKPTRSPNRSTADEIRPDHQLNRLRDVADPDSEVSRRLGSWIAHWSEHRQEIAIELSRSRDNAIEVKPVLERYASLREAIPLAEHVRDLSIASMEAMNYVAEHRAPSKAWVTRQRQLLERTSVARADLTVTLVGTLRTLLDLASATR
jgi:hexosaminidase